MKKRIFSWLLLFSMVFTLLPQTSLNVFAADDESSYKQMTMYDQNSTTPISITENTVLTLGGTNTITSTGSPIQLADGVTLSIVMSEGSETTLTCTATEADVDSVQGKTAGIYVPKTATLNIRNANDLNPGKLTVTGGYGGAGIGGGSAASAYEDKDPGKAGDGEVGKAVANATVSSTIKSSSGGWTTIFGSHNQRARGSITSIPSWVLNYAKSLAPTDMQDVPGGSGGTHGRNAVDNTQDCGTVVIKGGTIYAYGGQGGAGIGGGAGSKGEIGGVGEIGKASDGKAYGETKQEAVMGGADGYLIRVKSSVAGGSGGGAGGNGGQGGRGSNGGDVTIDGGTIVAVGGKNGTSTAAGIGGGAGGTGGNGGNGGDGATPDENGLAGRGGDGQAGYGGSGGNSGDAGTLTINGGKVISKGNNGFGVGNYGSVGENGTTRGQAKTSGTDGGSAWKTSWGILQQDPNNHTPIAATARYDYEGVGGAGGEGGKSTPVSAVGGNPGTAGANTINKINSNLVFIDESGNISSKNLPTNGKEKLYEYSLTVTNALNAVIENAKVKVKDADGNVIAQTTTRTTEEADEITAIADGTKISRYGRGVATLWLPEGTYTLSGDDISHGDASLPNPVDITVTASESGEGGKRTVSLGGANIMVDWGKQYWDPKVPNKFTYKDAKAIYTIGAGDTEGKLTQLDLKMKNGVTLDLASVARTPNYTSTNKDEYIWIFNTKGEGETDVGYTPAQVSEMLQKMEFYYDEETATDSGAAPMEIVAELDANKITDELLDKKIGIWDHTDGTKHYYTEPMFGGNQQWDALNLAGATRLLGRRGYLATLNSTAEITWARRNISSGNFRIGASRVAYNDNQAKVLYPYDSARDIAHTYYTVLGYYWMDGPETGEAPKVNCDLTRFFSSQYGHPYTGVIIDSDTTIYWLNSYNGWPTWATMVEYGGWEAAGQEEPGERTEGLLGDGVTKPQIRKKSADNSRLYRYYLTVYDRETNLPVEGATVDVTSITDTPNQLSYVTDANGVAVIWLPEGSHTLTGAMVTKDGKQIIDGRKAELTVRADHYNAGAVYIGGENTSLKVNLGEFAYSASEPNTVTFPNAVVTVGDSHVETKVKWMRVAGTDALIKSNTITSESDAVFTKDTDGNTSEVAWYFETPKTVAEATEILKNLTYYYEKKEGSTGAVKVEVDANETTANTKALTIKEYDGRFYALVNTATDKTWDGSYTNAKTYTYRGRMGYLATLTTAEEEKFTHDAFGVSQYWIGGTSLVDKNFDADKNKERMVDRKLIAAGDWKNLNLSGGRTAVIPYYYWSAGPEAGQTIAEDRWNAGDPSGGNDVATFMYYQNSDRQGLWDVAETQTLNSLIEFGGYNVGNDPGGYEEPNYSTDTVELVERTDQNGTPIYKYVAKVYDVKTQNVVDGATLKIKVPSPDGDPSKAYVYKGDEGGVLTDATGEAILWLPAGTYAPKDDEVYKEGIGGLNPSIDSTFEVTSDNKGETIYFWIGESSLDLKLGTHDVIKDGNGELWITFPYAEVIRKTADAEESTMLSISVSNVDDSKKINVTDAVNATEDWDMTDLLNHTYVWVFGTDGAGSNDKAQTILRNIKFPYSKDIQISVELDSNSTSDALKKEEAVKNGNTDGYKITKWEGNSNFYMYIAKHTYWTDAYNIAKSYMFGGRKGYLATITQREELFAVYNLDKKAAWLGGSAVVMADGSEINDADSLPTGTGKLKNRTGYSSVGNADSTNAPKYYVWNCGPQTGMKLTDTNWQSNDIHGVNAARMDASKIYNTMGFDGEENCLMLVGGDGTINDICDANYAKGGYYTAEGLFIEFGGYREGMDPGHGITIKRASDTRTINLLEAYYTYPVVDANDVQKNTYADKQAALEANGGYKLQLTTAFGEALKNNVDYDIDTGFTWKSGDALPDPMPETSEDEEKTLNSSYTYDMGKYRIISMAGLFAGEPTQEGETASGFAALEKLDLTEYVLNDKVNVATMFSNTGKTTDNEFPALGLTNDTSAAIFNDQQKTGIDITRLYFGNVAKIDYGANATNSEGTSQYGYAYGRNGIDDEAVTKLAVSNTNSRFVKMGAGEYLKGFQTPLSLTFHSLDYKNNKDATLTLNNADFSEDEVRARVTNTLRYTITAKLYDTNSKDVSNILVQPVKKSGKNYLRFITLVKGDVTGTDAERNKKIETISEVGFVIAADGTGTNPTIQAGYQYNGGGQIYERLRALASGYPGPVIWNMDMLNASAGFTGGVGFRYTDVAFKENREYAVTPYVITTAGEKEYGITRTVQFTQADFDQMMQSSKPTGN